MISVARDLVRKIILTEEEKRAQADELHKWSTRQKWQAMPDILSLNDWSVSQTKSSHDFFSADAAVIEQNGNQLRFRTPLESLHPENNWVYGNYFPSPKAKSAVIILGHWNSSFETYNNLAKYYQLSGLSALRLSLPYHDQRRPKDMPIASGLLSADLNQTISSIRQGVLETRAVVHWLKERGYQKIGVLGASMGSSIALLSACHDKNINAMVGYLAAADTAELIWESSATKHLRQSFEPEINLDQLKEAWSCISPSNYLQHLARPDFSMHVGWAKYDTVCPPYLTQRMLDTLNSHGVSVDDFSYRCGHNTLGMAPFKHISGLRGLQFMRRALR